MKLTQGRSIVNSISLKDGSELFVSKARTIKTLGCVPITIAFDELGQATTCERRLEICRRAFKLLTARVGYAPQDVIFDLNTFAVATGIPDHNANAAMLLKAIKLVRCVFPSVTISAGVSNLSFAFRGDARIRRALHSAFLESARGAGLNMAIVNTQEASSGEAATAEASQVCKALILNLRSVAPEEVIGAFASAGVPRHQASSASTSWRSWGARARVAHAVVSGTDKHVADDSVELAKSVGALAVVEGALMDGMSVVGKLFEKGKMFLPQVVKSARVMKKAVQALAPMLAPREAAKPHTVVLATVKGDVHDIGKNIVAAVLACNSFRIVDLGIMAASDAIISAAIAEDAVAIGLSGLISPSLDEMARVARKLQARGVTTPLLVGGATTSKLHTAIRLGPEYQSGVVIHVSDASKAVDVLTKLSSSDKAEFVALVKAEQALTAEVYARAKACEACVDHNRAAALSACSSQHPIKAPSFVGLKLTC